MSEWWLLFSLILLVLLALPFIIYPLPKTKKHFLWLPLLVIALSFAYWHWGSWSDWQEAILRQAKQKQVEAVLKTIKGPEELISKMKIRLKENPESSRGWYFLGRLYASQHQWTEARDSFFKARQLNPQDESVTINYAQSLWQINKQECNDKIREIYYGLLQKNPNQPDALAMLAMDAFTHNEYQLAVSYWQHLLKLAPEQSEEARMIRKAIAKAEDRLNLRGNDI